MKLKFIHIRLYISKEKENSKNIPHEKWVKFKLLYSSIYTFYSKNKSTTFTQFKRWEKSQNLNVNEIKIVYCTMVHI